MNIRHLEPSPETVHWGYFDASLPPQLTIDSGDTRDDLHGLGHARADAAAAADGAGRAAGDPCAGAPKLPGRTCCTGPVAVRGAKAGQVLEVASRRSSSFYDWGYHTIRPLAGALPDDFAEQRLIHIALDRARMIGKLPWGQEMPLRPFFGVMAVAPPAAWGAISTAPPRKNGGNLDNKELVAGTTLYLPIHRRRRAVLRRRRPRRAGRRRGLRSRRSRPV